MFTWLNLILISGLLRAEVLSPPSTSNIIEEVDDEESGDEKPIETKTVKLESKLFHSIVCTLNGVSEESKLTIYQVVRYISDKLKGRPFTIFDKENQELCKQAIKHFIKQLKILLLLKAEVSKNPTYNAQFLIAKEYARTMALSDLLVSCLAIDAKDIEATKRTLSENSEWNITITYALFNLEEQAKSVINLVNLNINDKSTKDNFTEAASQYAKVKASGQNYPRSENYFISFFGNEVLGAIKDVPEGQCLKKAIYLPKYKKWLLFHMDKKDKKIYQDSEIAYYSVLQKIQEMVTERISELQKANGIQLINPKFYEELDSDPNVSKVLIKIGPKKVTVGDLKRSIEKLRPNVNPDDLLAQYKQQGNPEYGKQLCLQALNFSVKLVIQSMIAEELNLHLDNEGLYQEYVKANEEIEFIRLLENLIKQEVTNNDIAEAFKLALADPEKKQTFSDTMKFRGIYLGLESKDILDRLKLRILHSDKESLEQFIKQLVLDYSIYPVSSEADLGQYSFNERRNKVTKMFGDFYELNTGSRVEDVKPNTFYFAISREKELYHLIFIKDVYKEDVTLDEKAPELEVSLVDKKIEDMLSKVTIHRK